MFRSFPRRISFCFVLALAAALQAAPAYAQSATLDAGAGSSSADQSGEFGDPLRVDFSASGGNPNSWIGLYNVEATHNSQYLQSWVVGTASSGTLVSDLDLPAGNYEFRYMTGYGWDDIARSDDVNIPLTGTPTSVDSDDQIVVDWATPAGEDTAFDWIGLYRVDGPNPATHSSQYITYFYIDTYSDDPDSRTGRAGFSPEGLGLAPGTYQFWYMDYGNWGVVRTSNTFTVGGGGA